MRGPADPIGATIEPEFIPDEVWVTSLFTYWARYVRDTVSFYKSMFPGVPVTVGGVLASLLDEKLVKEQTGCDRVYQGVIAEAELCDPAYDLVEEDVGAPLGYQILHTSRGCTRRCDFCGTWRIEPTYDPVLTIKDRVTRPRVVFYDNNLLANPHIEHILDELIELKRQRRLLWCESQSGFDGRILVDKPHLAKMLKKAGFRYPRIAWDGGICAAPHARAQLDLLQEAGYALNKDVYLFVLYNWDLSFAEMEQKRLQCWEWRVQISDCRFRPLNQLYDEYRGAKPHQTSDDYYIHETAGWTDALIKQYRRNVREQNICVRHGFDYYSRALEVGAARKRAALHIPLVTPLYWDGRPNQHRRGCWNPGEVRYPAEDHAA
ncbi:MAG: Fe-S oxidoreductase [Bacillota bacterium]